MTTPPFFLVFLGWLVCVRWARWLAPKVGEGFAGITFWGGGACILLGLGSALASVVWAAPGSAEWVAMSSWFGAAVIGMLLSAALVLTVRSRAQPG